MAQNIDPVTLAVIQSSLQQVCNEMDLAFERSAFSPVIAEARDRSDGIYHRDDGALIAQGELGLPIFVGTMQDSTAAVVERARDLKPGDVYVVNDPYLGGTHLMDVRFAMPFFYQGELFCWLSNTGHWRDTGGMVPGGFAANATEVEQEGLRLPPVKLVKAGLMDEEILSIIMSNIRVANETYGDIMAQAAALKVGETRLTAVLDRYGKTTVEDCIVEMRARAARLMRARIAQVPDGIYQAQTFVDSDGIVNEPLCIALSIEKKGTDLHFDFAGTSAPCRGPMNAVIATTKSSIYLAIKHIFPDVPINAGMFEPLHIVPPVGTFLYAEYPRPVSGCAAEVSQRIAEAVFLCMAQAIPDQLFAASAGTVGNFVLGGYDEVARKPFVLYLFTGGGYGGALHGDGLSNGCSTIGISKMPPIEVMEQRYPLIFDEFALHEGSGGAGEHRGGFGVRYTLRLQGGSGTAAFLGDHGRFGPPGVLGGKHGGTNQIRVHRAGDVYQPEHYSKDQGIVLDDGHYVTVSTPGGGGYGSPLARDPNSVATDVRRGYYTCQQARERFGVILSVDFEVDAAATRNLREEAHIRSV
jgi:N-methylhydantoinase B